MKRPAPSLLPFYLGSMGSGSLLLSLLALRTGQAAAEPVVLLGLLSAPALLLAAAGLGGARGEWPRFHREAFARVRWSSPASLYRWCLLATLLASLGACIWVVRVGAAWIAAASLLFQGFLAVAGLLAAATQGCLVALPLSSGRRVLAAPGLVAGALTVTGLAWAGSWMRLLLILRLEPEASLGASRLENVILWLLLLALALWVSVDRRRHPDPSPDRDQRRVLFWIGLTLGFAIPLLLLDRGGRLAELGALLALTGSLGTVRESWPS